MNHADVLNTTQQILIFSLMYVVIAVVIATIQADENKVTNKALFISVFWVLFVPVFILVGAVVVLKFAVTLPERLAKGFLDLMKEYI